MKPVSVNVNTGGDMAREVEISERSGHTVHVHSVKVIVLVLQGASALTAYDLLKVKTREAYSKRVHLLRTTNSVVHQRGGYGRNPVLARRCV